MRLLSRYICAYFLRYFSVGLLVCTGLFFLVDLFDSIDDFMARQVFWGDALHYLCLRLPGLISQIVPAIFLLASVLTFSTLMKYNEIVAIRGSGLAPLRLAGPIFLLGCLGGLLLLVAQEYLLPYTQQAYRLLWRTRIQHEPMAQSQEMLQRGHFWYRAGSRIWSVEIGLPSARRLLGVTIYELDASGLIWQRYDAAEARWTPQGWTLLQGVRRTFGTDEVFITPPEYFVRRQVDFAERFVDMQTVRKEPEEMSLRELQAYAAQLQRRGESATEYVVALHSKLTFAVLCVIMAGFGAPLALRLNRNGGTVRAIGLTLLCGFGYWVIHSLVLAMGYNGQLPPLLAAWSTSAGFGAGQAYLTYRLQ